MLMRYCDCNLKAFNSLDLIFCVPLPPPPPPPSSSSAVQSSAPASLKMFHLCRPNCTEEEKKVSKWSANTQTNISSESIKIFPNLEEKCWWSCLCSSVESHGEAPWSSPCHREKLRDHLVMEKKLHDYLATVSCHGEAASRSPVTHSFLILHLLASSSWGCPLWQSFSYLEVGPVTIVERAIEFELFFIYFIFILFFRGLFWISHSPSRVGRVWNSCGFSGWAAGVPGCLSMFLLVDFVAPGVFFCCWFLWHFPL